MALKKINGSFMSISWDFYETTVDSACMSYYKVPLQQRHSTVPQCTLNVLSEHSKSSQTRQMFAVGKCLPLHCQNL